MSRPIAVLGSVNIDLVLRCTRLPRPGETVHGSDPRSVPGGKGANQAVAAARLGAPVVFIGAVGDDDFGRQARLALEAEAIDTRHLRTVAGAATGIAMILVEDSGQNAIALAAGANASVDIAQVDAARADIEGASLLVCQLESPLEAVRHAIGLAHAAGVPVLLNPAPAVPLPAALLAQVDVLVPNESEAAVLAGLAPGAPFDAATTAERLHRETGARVVIVTLGAGGVMVAADGAAPRHLAAPAVRAVDTTGAGDTFIGAFAAARCAGASLDAALAHGQAAAALSVTRPGAMAAMPRRDELPALSTPSAP